MVRTVPKAAETETLDASLPNNPPDARKSASSNGVAPIPNPHGATLKDAFPTCEGELDLTRSVEYPREVEL